MASCLETYECRERGCYAQDVGMGSMCPGVEAREAMADAEVAARGRGGEE
jgi:hypothetical protein